MEVGYIYVKKHPKLEKIYHDISRIKKVDDIISTEKRISNWILDCITREGYTLNHLDFMFMDDEYIRDINIKNLNHDYYTDVISLDYSNDADSFPNSALVNTNTDSNLNDIANQKFVEGDIFISLDRVQDNAILYNTTFQNELLRVMIHGVLHLTGYDDITPPKKKIMKAKEDEYLEKCVYYQ